MSSEVDSSTSGSDGEDNAVAVSRPIKPCTDPEGRNILFPSSAVRKVGALTKRERDSWGTPPELFYWIDVILGFNFEVDAAATEENSLCSRFFIDGLNTVWSRHAKRIYGNPPYSDIYRWLEKAYTESQLGCTCVMLIPSHKGESWWDECIVGRAESVLLLKGRIRFIHPVTGMLEKQAPFGSSLVIYSPCDRLNRETVLKTAKLVDIFAQVYQAQGRDIRRERRERMQEKRGGGRAGASAATKRIRQSEVECTAV